MTMKTRNLLLSVPLFILLIGGASVASASTSAKGEPKTRLAAASPDGPESALREAMPADVVRKIMGEPLEIKPMKAPDGKAEIWVFRRQVNIRVERVPIGSIPITVSTIGADGKPHEQTVGENIQYGDMHRATEETVQLLMFNDHYLTHKITRQEIRHLN